MGTDRCLVGWQEMLTYYRALATASDRLRFDELGPATLGEPLALLTISAPENLARLDDLKHIQQRLADPRQITDAAESTTLLRDGRTICLFTCSIHATEVGGVQMTPELVHSLVTRSDPEVERILSEVLLLLVPSLNPDGMNLVKDWYARTLDTPFEGTAPPNLYHPYAGHDNNRDWFMQTLVETRLIVDKVHNAWRPHIVFDLHQMQTNGPRYVVPPFIDPYDPNIDPLVPAQINALGATIAAELTAEGKTGVATSIIFDAYSPARSYQHYHGGIRILSEAASVKIATPIDLRADQLAETRGFTPTVSTQNHPVPWVGGRWTLRDIVEYNLTSAWTVLNHAARYRDRWVRNFALIQQRSLQLERPFAFIIPAPEAQRDPVTTVELLNVLRSGDVEIQRAAEPFTADGVEYPAGTYIVLMAQPFGRYAKTLLEVQHYPPLKMYPGGPPRPPYDITAHTLPLQMGVTAMQVESPFPAKMDEIHTVNPPRSGIHGNLVSASDFLLGPEANASARIVNAVLASGGRIERTTKPLLADGRIVEPGAYVFRDQSQSTLDHLSRTIGLVVSPLKAAPAVPTQLLSPPRIGLYRSWRPNAIDAGWTSLVLEQYDFPFATLRDKDIRQGDLARSFDVLILPHEQPKDILEGNSAAEYPAEFAGGIGDLGAANLRRFVEDGGTLITLDAACDLAIRHLYVPISNVLENLRLEEFYSPGSLLRLLVDPNHPIGWGFERESVGMFVSSPAFDIYAGTGVEAQIVAQYPLTNQLLSGWMLGAERIAGRAAVVEVPVGRGRVILIGLRAQFRAQARATYKLLFNAIYRSTLAPPVETS